MRDVAALLGHPEEEAEDDDDEAEGKGQPPVPPLPGRVNGSK